MPSPTPCRVVTLEWDRGHESLDAVVRAESEHGVIVTEVIDFASAPGLRWIRRDEILQMEDYNPDLAVVRLVKHNQVVGVGVSKLAPTACCLASGKFIVAQRA